jgi:hypothetical protein
MFLPFPQACPCCFSIFFNKKKKLGEKIHNFFFLLLSIAFQILHVFLLNILVHCALIECAYI